MDATGQMTSDAVTRVPIKFGGLCRRAATTLTVVGILVGGEPPAIQPVSGVERIWAAQVTPTVVYEGARLIAGDDGPPIEDSALVVSGGVISAVGPRDTVDTPAGATVVDVAGKTIIPALVDLHGHVGFQRGLSYAAENYTRENVVDHLHRYAYYGVGTVVSLGTDAGSLWYEIRRDQEAGTLGGARLFTAGRGLAAPNAGPGAAALRPSAGGVTSPEEGRAFVRRLAEQGVAFVKIWVDDRGGTVEKLAPEIYRAIIDEAHGLGLQVIAHVFYHDDATDLVEAGVDGFAHLVRDREMDETLVAAMARDSVFVMPNMGVSERGRHTRAPAWLAEPLLAETVSPEVLDRAAGAFARRSEEAAARAGASYAAMERSLGRLAAASVPLVLGSDSGVQDHFYGFAAHRELELMVAAGLSPMDALLTATSRSADRLGLATRVASRPGRAPTSSCSRQTRWTTSRTRGASRASSSVARKWTGRRCGGAGPRARPILPRSPADRRLHHRTRTSSGARTRPTRPAAATPRSIRSMRATSPSSASSGGSRPSRTRRARAASSGRRADRRTRRSWSGAGCSS